MHYLFKQVDEISVAHPFVTVIVESFLKCLHQSSNTLSEKLVLLGHDLGVVASCHAKETHVNPTVAVKRQHATLQGKPEWEPRKHLKKNAAETPDVKDE